MLCSASPAYADTIDIAQLRANAESGNAAAQIDLAHAYHDGTDGLKPNDEEAVKWFEKAAQQGDLDGQYNLAIAYYHGFGVKKNLIEAVKWFTKAADQGYAGAQYILASAYQNGMGGVPKDIVQADMWLALAEAGGHPDASRERIALEGQMTAEEITRANILLAAHGSATIGKYP